jgi:5-methylcytosine-specific restriction endonuclease McrA
MFWDEPKPKPKKKAIPKSVKVTVWSKYIGADKAEGKCYVCKRTIHITDFDVGHNKAKAKGGTDNISNLRPICRSCNTSMGTTCIEAFKAKHFGKVKSRTKTAVGLDKVQTYLTKQGYAISSKKHGFALVGMKESTFDQDRYVVVGFNYERTVTGEYVLKFKKKVSAFYKMISEKYFMGTPHVEGLIAHTGTLSKDAPVVVKASKPTIKYKKF